MRGGARLEEMAEDDLGRVVRAAPLQPEPHGVALYVLWTWSPQLSVPQHERAYGGRGGRKVSDMKTIHWKRKLGAVYLPQPLGGA